MATDQPPQTGPTSIEAQLRRASAARCREIAQYAAQLAEQKDPTGPVVETDPTPEEVPSKATLTTKDINGNQYHYWQWREADTVKSRYIGPVNT